MKYATTALCFAIGIGLGSAALVSCDWDEQQNNPGVEIDVDRSKPRRTIKPAPQPYKPVKTQAPKPYKKAALLPPCNTGARILCGVKPLPGKSFVRKSRTSGPIARA